MFWKSPFSTLSKYNNINPWLSRWNLIFWQMQHIKTNSNCQSMPMLISSDLLPYDHSDASSYAGHWLHWYNDYIDILLYALFFYKQDTSPEKGQFYPKNHSCNYNYQINLSRKSNQLGPRQHQRCGPHQCQLSIGNGCIVCMVIGNEHIFYKIQLLWTAVEQTKYSKRQAIGNGRILDKLEPVPTTVFYGEFQESRFHAIYFNNYYS